MFVRLPVVAHLGQSQVVGIVYRKLLKRMVGARGFEPPTPWSRTRCATRLRYAPNGDAEWMLVC